MTGVCRIILALMMCAVAAVSSPADELAPQLRYRQYHLFFHVVDGPRPTMGRSGGPQGPVVAAQEIVVLMSDADTVYAGEAGAPRPTFGRSGEPTFSFSLPEGAHGVDLLEVPPMMGDHSNPPLTDADVKIEPTRLNGFAPIHPGKNSYSYGYLLPIVEGRAVWKKTLDYDADLMVSFVPKIARVSSQALNVEATEDGYKVIGSGLKRGQTVDLTLEGIEPPGHAESAHPALQPSGIDDPANAMALAILLGLSIAALAVGGVLALRRRAPAQSAEIESLAQALERGEIKQEYFLRRLRELMGPRT